MLTPYVTEIPSRRRPTGPVSGRTDLRQATQRELVVASLLARPTLPGERE